MLCPKNVNICVFDGQTRVLRRELLAEIGDEALAKHQIVVGDPSSFQVRLSLQSLYIRGQREIELMLYLSGG